MLSCKETTRLISESLERKIPFRQRMQVGIHLILCRLCSRFKRQLFILAKAIRAFVEAEKEGDLPAGSEESLSPEARRRIEDSLKRETR